MVDAAGEWASGGEAVARICERVALLTPLARVLRWRLVAPLVEPGYRWLAANRARFAFMAGSFGPAQRIGRR